MTEIRLSIIKNHEDANKDKRVEIHITDVDAVLGAIKADNKNPLAPGAGELLDLVTTALTQCDDTDKVEIGRDEEGKANPQVAFVAKSDGSGKKIRFAL